MRFVCNHILQQTNGAEAVKPAKESTGFKRIALSVHPVIHSKKGLLKGPTSYQFKSC